MIARENFYIGEVMNILIVMIGGFFGSICRFGLGEWLMTGTGFPVGTFVINIIGCFALGWLLTMATLKKNIPTKIVLMGGTGFLGSFTTYSTFSVETINLVSMGQIFETIVYVLGSIFVGLLFTYLGWKTAIVRSRVGGDLR